MDKITSLIDNRFTDLKFEEEGHKYYLGEQNLTPVSDVIKNYYEPFNAKEQAKSYAERHGGQAHEWENKWKKNGDDACNLGHNTHEFGELYFYDKTLKPSTGHELAVVEFWNDIPSHIVPILPERTMYSRKYKYAGTCDLLLYDKWSEGLIIADYKTNLNIFKNFRGKRMLPPFEDLLDSPMNHYQLQLSMYQIPLEDIGLKVIDRWIIWLKADGTYDKYETIDLTSKLRNLLT